MSRVGSHFYYHNVQLKCLKRGPSGSGGGVVLNKNKSKPYQKAVISIFRNDKCKEATKMISSNNYGQNVVEIVLPEYIDKVEFSALVETLDRICDDRSNVKLVFNTLDQKNVLTFKMFLHDLNFYRRYSGKISKVAFLANAYPPHGH